MSSLKLEAPRSADDLYLARGHDVPSFRPISTGDVFDDVPLTMGDEARGRAIVLTHPCTMRKDGVHLVDRLLVAPVRPHNEIPFAAWTGNYKVMPLPELAPGTHHAAHFLELEPIDSTDLDAASRIAALTPRGVNLLLQRLVHHMSRVVVETDRFAQACASAFSELEIVEDWIEAASDAGLDHDAAAVACHDWLRDAPGDGPSPQERLVTPQERATVRREARKQARHWIDAADNPDETV